MIVIWMRRFCHLCAMAALCVANSAYAQAPQSDDELAAIMRFVPPQAQAAIVVPNLKRLSDQITQCLEGMDRAEVLMGSRPIDQFKAAADLNVGINDLGGMAVIFTNLADPEKIRQPLFIVPVSDTEAFLEGNFTRREDDSYEFTGGRAMFAKPLVTHVALSSDAAAVQEYPGRAADLRDSPLNSFGARGAALAKDGDLIVIGRGEGLAAALQQFQKTAADRNPPIPIGDIPAATLLDDLEVGVATLDFDPLGLIARSVARFKDESELANLFKIKSDGAGADLSRLPNKVFHVALGWHLGALGGDAHAKDALAAIGVPPLPEWISLVQSVQFAAYPSPAGLTGGLLNDAALVLRTSDPQALKRGLREAIESLKTSAGATREIKWEADKPVKDAGMADAYEIRILEQPPQELGRQLSEQMLFGSGARRGFIAATSESVIVTFSQRPAVLASALNAANANLESHAAIKIMRQWMPPNRWFEFYLNLGTLLQVAAQGLERFGGADAMMQGGMPQIEPSSPPIGFGIGHSEGAMETTTVLPAAILAAWFDASLRQARDRAGPPDDEELEER